MATVRQRSGGWNVYWRLGGRGGPTQSITFDTEEHAHRAAEIAKAHRHQITDAEVESVILGEPIPAADNGPQLPTVAEWADEYLTSKTRITPGTKHRYRRQLDLVILPALGHMRLNEVDATHIARLLNDLRSCDCLDGVRGPRCNATRSGHGYDDRTVTRYYSLISAMFAYAVREGRIPTNPAARTDWVRDLIAHDDPDPEGADHVYLSHAEYEMIRQHAAPDAQPLLDYLVGTGARWSEATAAAIDSIDPLADPPVARIYRAWRWRPAPDLPADETDDDEHEDDAERSGGEWYLGPPKSRAKRIADIGQVLLDTLMPLLSDPGKAGTDLLFTAPEGGRWIYSNFRHRRWEPAITAAMRCPLHPPLPRGRQVAAEQLAGPRCGDNGGARNNGAPCGARVDRGWDRCKEHRGVARTAVSDCPCPTRLHKRPTIHDLRHSHATWLIADGVPLVEVSQRLGHHSITITERVYAGRLHTTRTNVTAALDKAMGGRSATPAAARRPG